MLTGELLGNVQGSECFAYGSAVVPLPHPIVLLRSDQRFVLESCTVWAAAEQAGRFCGAGRSGPAEGLGVRLRTRPLWRQEQ